MLEAHKRKKLMPTRKSILCLVPLPPPITGAALASENVVSHIAQSHEVVVLEYQRGNLISGKFSLRQVFRILLIGCRLFLLRLLKQFDHAYLVVSSSFLGNIRDLFFMIMMGSKLRKRLTVHLHGANIDTYLQAASVWLKFLNRVLYKDVKSAIVLGETFHNIFDGYVPLDKVRIVKNYFDPHLLIPEAYLQQKYKAIEKVNFLFLSNLIKEKGYEKLLDAFLCLDGELSNKAVLCFAGAINSPAEKESFLKKIADKPNIRYHGPVIGEEKKRLLWDSHVFCLPTFFKYEGQPISVLEAYASGCVVLTTQNGGIRDIFVNAKNGYFINEELEIDVVDLKKRLEYFILNMDGDKAMAEYNREEAVQKYMRETFNREIDHIVLNS